MSYINRAGAVISQACSCLYQIITLPYTLLSLFSNELYTADVLDFLEIQEHEAEPIEISWDPQLPSFEMYAYEAVGG